MRAIEALLGVEMLGVLYIAAITEGFTISKTIKHRCLPPPRRASLALSVMIQ